jgi:MOSC domain-containing protein YiiM
LQFHVRVLSVNAGLPQEVEWNGRTVLTSIFKESVAGPVAVRRENLDGDRQSDLSVHGGPTRAVYVYRTEHYAAWRAELPGAELPWGAFGENLSVAGLPAEAEILVGDRYRFGTAVLAVTQPRLPCFKLGLRFGRPDMVKRMLASGRTGFYSRVEAEGVVEAGDAIELLSRSPGRLRVADITRLYAFDHDDVDGMRLAAEDPGLPEDWREWFRRRLAAVP